MTRRPLAFGAALLLLTALACSSRGPTGSALPEMADLPAQTVVYYNARIALRQGRHKDVIKLWLLRNTLASQGEAPIHDNDFRSTVWAALSGAGLCHDGFRQDDDEGGAGLWPLALHNWLTRSSSRQLAPEQPRTFTSFNSGFQQRRVSLHDVLTAEELGGTRFMRGNCWRPYLTLVQLGTPHWLNLRDRLSTGIMMRDLIELAQSTLHPERVRGQVMLETRLFDLEVALARLARSKARRETGLVAQIAKTTGVSDSAMTLLREQRYAEVRQSKYTELLRRCLRWPVEDWLSLSQQRSLALFGESSENYRDDKKLKPLLDRTLLQNIDALIERSEGKPLSQWLGFANPRVSKGETQVLAQITEGKRGERLLSLDPDTGFRERSAIALRRGTSYLTKGQPLNAMRSFALAMKYADDSRMANEVHSLAKRWFGYVLAQHRASDEVLALLREFVSPIDRNQLLEVLLWRAAFHADETSFEHIAAGVRQGGSLDFRVQQLRFLARGDAGAFWRQIRDQHAENPNSIYRFVKLVTEELATEPLDVRLKNRITLELASALLGETIWQANPGLVRRIDAQQQRIQILLDGLDIPDSSPTGVARSAAPGSEAYAGSVRLAPADPLPWPFAFPRVLPPSPFSPIQLTPVEWFDNNDQQVFGWHIHDQ